MDRGTLTAHEGRSAVRFQRTYPQPPERVWRAITDPGELAHWFPSIVHLEPRIGGMIKFSGDPYQKPTSGRILTYDPPRRLVFTWGPSELHFELTPDAGSGCRLIMLDVLATRDSAARNAAGWSVCLAELDKHLAGEVAEGPHSGSAEPWQPHYEAYLALGMPAGAPIPSKIEQPD